MFLISAASHGSLSEILNTVIQNINTKWESTQQVHLHHPTLRVPPTSLTLTLAPQGMDQSCKNEKKKKVHYSAKSFLLVQHT